MRYDRTFVVSLHQFAPAVLAEIIRRQPASRERTAFAWSVAVGPALARVTTPDLPGRTTVATARDVRRAKEIDRARDDSGAGWQLVRRYGRSNRRHNRIRGHMRNAVTVSAARMIGKFLGS